MDVFAARTDHIVGAADQIDVPVRVPQAHVAGVVPAVAHLLRGGIRPVEVLAEYGIGGGVDDQFPLLARPHQILRLAIDGDDPRAAIEAGTQPDMLPDRVGVVERAHGLGRAVDVPDRPAPLRVHPIQKLRCDLTAAVERQFHTGKGARIVIGRLGHGVVELRNREHVGDAVGRHHFIGLNGIEGGLNEIRAVVRQRHQKYAVEANGVAEGHEPECPQVPAVPDARLRRQPEYAMLGGPLGEDDALRQSGGARRKENEGRILGIEVGRRAQG